jgi:quercetin dioxygenase-like cupin family protein
MKTAKLDDMVRGWFIGNFSPTIHNTDDFEVAIQHYKKGDAEPKHFHKVATEVTVILNGEASFNGQSYCDGDIITIFPGEANEFKAISDVTAVVVKYPCVKNDKFLVV